jgi:hypothetical protein
MQLLFSLQTDPRVTSISQNKDTKCKQQQITSRGSITFNPLIWHLLTKRACLNSSISSNKLLKHVQRAYLSVPNTHSCNKRARPHIPISSSAYIHSCCVRYQKVIAGLLFSPLHHRLLFSCSDKRLSFSTPPIDPFCRAIS